ncbi:YceI family protein [Tenacibaculum ovolyticum]|uniref:YceI family protein n=1 Tax=Tenacibaculum ovolyticum TaxID=104270 RepID=UPI003BAB1570
MRILVFFLILTQTISAQKYFTRAGITEFKASIDAFEPVEAINKSSSAILKTETGDFAALLLIKAFKFKIALMQEHFNENYMDSDQYPRATFKGKINNFDVTKINSEKKHTIEGILSIRNIKKDVKTNAKVFKKDGKIYIEATFKIKPQDYDIEIPKIVRKKIAKSIKITIKYELSAKE